METIRKRAVVVGDGNCGKTCLLIAFTKGYFPFEYVPTIYETYAADFQIDGAKVSIYFVT